MKDYIIILSSVKRSLKYYNVDYTLGYIKALWDWRVINLDTHQRLEDFIKRKRKEGDQHKT